MKALKHCELKTVYAGFYTLEPPSLKSLFLSSFYLTLLAVAEANHPNYKDLLEKDCLNNPPTDQSDLEQAYTELNATVLSQNFKSTLSLLVLCSNYIIA